MLLMEPLLETTRNILRQDLVGVENPIKSIRVTQDEQIPPYAGDEFINIYDTQMDLLSTEEDLARVEIYRYKIGITRRFAGFPADHLAESIYIEDLISQTKSSMCKRAYEIIALIDARWSIPALIRQMDTLQDTDFCIIGPMFLDSVSSVSEVFGDHFRNEEDDNDNPSGLFLEMSFSGLQTYYGRY